jgi:ABC-type transporter Mla subunit MlaD
MTRPKQRRKPNQRTRQHHSPKSEAQKLDELVQDTARVFTCALETAEDCATECERRLEDVDSDLQYRRVAHDIWKERTGRVETLVSAMADLIAENTRHRDAIAALVQRFDALAKLEHFHEHIPEPENYFELVRTRLFGAPTAP